MSHSLLLSPFPTPGSLFSVPALGLDCTGQRAASSGGRAATAQGDRLLLVQ